MSSPTLLSLFARFHDGAYVAPKCQYSIKADKLWISIGGDPSTIPSSAENASAATEGGILTDGPVPYDRQTHWRAWIPIGSPECWYAMDPGMMGGVTNGDHHDVDEHFQHVIAKDLSDAHCLMLAFVTRQREDDRKKTPQPIPLPSSPDITRLSSAFNSNAELVQFLTCVQRGFLEILGAIRWLDALDDEADGILGWVTLSVGFDAAKRLEDWMIFQPGGRGVLVDLLRDWREINIALYLEHAVPIHYAWSQTLHNDARFRSLSPLSLDASPEDVLSGSLPGWALSEPTEPHLTTFASDQFLQLRHPLNTAVEILKQSATGLKMTNSVVDFEGWKARDVFEQDKHRYLSELWYTERIVQNRVGQAQSRRVFHRYRPIVDRWDHYNYINAPKLENHGLIRELYKFSYCPPPFQRYIPLMSTAAEQVMGPTIPEDAPSIVPSPELSSISDPYTDVSVTDAELNLPTPRQSEASAVQPDVLTRSPSFPPSPPAPPPSTNPYRQVRFSDTQPRSSTTSQPPLSYQPPGGRGRLRTQSFRGNSQQDFHRESPPHLAAPSTIPHRGTYSGPSTNVNNSMGSDGGTVEPQNTSSLRKLNTKLSSTPARRSKKRAARQLAIAKPSKSRICQLIQTASSIQNPFAMPYARKLF